MGGGTHVLPHGEPDRTAEFVWATAAVPQIVAEPSLQSMPWRSAFERLLSVYQERRRRFAELTAADLDAASDWARANVAERMGQVPFHIPDCGVWRYDLRRYLARAAS